MRIIALVNDDQNETYTNKKTNTETTKRVLSLVDVGEGVKLKQIIEWNAPDDFEPASGQAIGTRVTLDITEIAMFGTRPRLRAVVVSSGE